MKIYLYTCEDDRKKIVKNPVKVTDKAISIKLKAPTSVMNPTVILSKSSVGENWASVNYAYIPEFQRYYFVDSIECRNSEILVFSMTVDVLYTYRKDLMTTQFEIARSEKINSSYYIDTEKALINRRVVKFFPIGTGKIPQSATGNKYTITVAGGF